MMSKKHVTGMQAFPWLKVTFGTVPDVVIGMTREKMVEVVPAVLESRSQSRDRRRLGYNR